MYVDGHERADIVQLRQLVFLPFMEDLLPRIRQWNADGTPVLPECLVGPWIGPCQIIFWCHDKSTFYANDRRKIRWVHESETAKPQAKGEGVSMMVADCLSRLRLAAWG